MSVGKKERGANSPGDRSRFVGTRGRVLGRLLVAISAAAWSAGAQTVAVPDQGPHSFAAPARILREINDPHTGDRWLLLPGDGHPAGPGRLVIASERAAVSPGSNRENRRPALAIHMGDKVVVEERTPVAEALWEAVALGPAMAGGPLDVRLRIGGKVMRVV